MTECERRLWRLLRETELDVRFRRQHPVGPYVLDFYCAPRKLAVELDGGGHFTEEALAKDLARSRFLGALGIRVLRFTNTQVQEETAGVLECIWQAMQRGT
jgi:very-short-patch-repair endonuclease